MNFLSLIILGLILTSCNSKVNEGADLKAVAEAQKSCVGSECAVCNLPWGGTLASGQTLDSVYSKSIVTCSEECTDKKVKVSCEEGILKVTDILGKLIDPSLGLTQQCYKQRCDCTHNGTVVEDGKELDFFKLSSTSCTTQCESRKLRCRSGQMEDSLEPSKTTWLDQYKYATCSHTACTNCIAPWGASVAHGATTKGYVAAQVNCGQNCASQQSTLTCNNGSLTGGNLDTYKFGSCSVKACLDCNLPSGDIIVHGLSTPVYGANQSTCTTTCDAKKINLTCNNGVVSGGDTAVYKYTSCIPAVCVSCDIPCGGTVASGGSRYCYKNTAPASCGLTCTSERIKFLCDNGVVKDEAGAVATAPTKALYVKSSCSDIAACSSCKLADGRSVIDGTKVTFFKAKAVACGQQCFSTTNSVTLACSNGTFANKSLYPDFINSSCEASCSTGTDGDNGVGNVVGDGGGAPRQMCQLPWRGGVVTHKTQITAYSRMSVPSNEKCSTYKKVIQCNGVRGLWTGGARYIYPTCVEE